MAAAPHLVGDPPVASPELALVDADLASQLRADLATGDAFRPREVPRAEYPTLVFDAVVRDLPVAEQDVSGDGALPAEEAVDPGDEFVTGDEPFASPHLVALDLPEEQTALVDEPAALSDQVVPDHELFTPALVLEAVAPSGEESYQLPEYVVEGAENLGDTVEELPDYILRPGDEPASILPDFGAPVELQPGDEAVDVVADDLVIVSEVVEVSAEDAAVSSDYPVLPDLAERSDSLEETEAALRRIREQLVPPTQPKLRPRLRRRFTIVAGLCAVTAAGVVAVDVQLGVAHAWLGF